MENYWAGKLTETELQSAGSELRLTNWQLQQSMGIDLIPSNDFSFYDHLLDMACMVGAVPDQLAGDDDVISLDRYFLMARGGKAQDGAEVKPLEMTKWFNTNYHYSVPAVSAETRFRIRSKKAFAEFSEAKAAGILTKPVLIGPVTLLWLAQKETPSLFADKLPELLSVYTEIIQYFGRLGAGWIQLDEPILSLDLNAAEQNSLLQAYQSLAEHKPESVRLLVANYFGRLGDNLATTLALPVDGIHLDLIAGAAELGAVLAHLPEPRSLSLGIISGRNVWKTDIERAATLCRRAISALGSDRVMLAPTNSLLHVPISLRAEPKPDQRLAFAEEKLQELVQLQRLLDKGDPAPRQPAIAHEPLLLAEAPLPSRSLPFEKRKALQAAKFRLPLFPTTTIGSLPQTAEVRGLRQRWKEGKVSDEKYESIIKDWTKEAIRHQEAIDLDVLVHGEFERTDMVEFFAEQLEGFITTEQGWVQSYGSRCVRPPILVSSVKRRGQMTVELAKYAQSLTDRPVKGMLTGPITILEWSFIREDQPWQKSAEEIAVAIQEEVSDLEAAGIGIIQIDEPAFRERLPLRSSDHQAYLREAVRLFRICCAAAKPETQIHTHMCYSDFNSIIDWIAQMDADVISIEASRSEMILLDAFKVYQYPNDIGPGVYDIHSPRVPSTNEMLELLQKALAFIPAEKLWVNPDCGLKTRKPEETWLALERMALAAKELRKR